MEMEVTTLSPSVESKVRNYACVCVCADRCTDSVCARVSLLASVCVHFGHRDIQVRHMRRGVQKVSQVPKQINLKFLLEVAGMQLLYFKRHMGVKKKYLGSRRLRKW